MEAAPSENYSNGIRSNRKVDFPQLEEEKGSGLTVVLTQHLSAI